MDCRDTCATAVPKRLVQPPCFICRGVSVSIPPSAPGTPTDDFGVSPSPFSLKPDGTLIVGTGISGANASVGSDGVIELFVAPFIGDVSGSELTYPYSVELQDGQELAFAFGVTLKSGYGVRITEYYDVTMVLDLNGTPKTLHLIPANTKSGYTWTDNAGYNITDSDGDLHTVQNVTRPSFFGVEGPGFYGVIISAHSKITNLDTAVISAGVTVTNAD